MSEFVSTCPKCQGSIMGDTAYVGKRVACPLCLQEIAMPAPPGEPAATAGNPSAPARQGGKRMVSLPLVAGLAVLVAAATAAGMYVVANQRAASAPAAETPPPPPTAVAAPQPTTQPTVAAPSIPALVPGHYKIINQLGGLSLACVTNTVGTNSFSKAVLQPFDGSQVWDIRQVDTNYAINLLHGPCLQLAASHQSGLPLEFAKWVHVPRQIWIITPLPDGIYEIESAANSLLVDVPVGKPGQPVVQSNSHRDHFSGHWIIQAEKGN